ncbi:hypothetical protein SAMN05421548_10514 [Paraburkholderia lycopersici]|uniref:Uncharacterized protein n=1 Tax=Paraburkholderia lycopersici TaxID=416944 RepID=A0A1G6JXB2_9BURK|nr:hypothetical protein SAMN05421548_10514 [Paraburkholderia lycopersici]
MAVIGEPAIFAGIGYLSPKRGFPAANTTSRTVSPP